MIEYLKKHMARLTSIGADPSDSDDIRLKKTLLVICALPFAFVGIAWGLMYSLFDEPRSGMIPFSYGIISLCSITYFGLTRRYRFFRFSQLVLILLLPFFLMTALGGFVNGSIVILWAVICPLGALVFDEPRRAILWLLAYVGLLVLSGILEPHLRASNNLSTQAETFFFVINLVGVSLIIFLMVSYFVMQKEAHIELMRRNRELEQSYLQQEVMLRQSEKLATLGKLSAGMAHEINNPASAAVRSSKQLQDIILESEELLVQLGAMNLSSQQSKAVESLKREIQSRAKSPPPLDALTRSDHEAKMEAWLEKRAVTSAWDVASMLATLGFNEGDLSTLTESFADDQIPIILASMRSIYMAHNLLDEIGQGTGRITELVRSLKSYSYMDHAPMQSIDIHDGINDTLVMLRSRLKVGVAVERDFDERLPRIQAYGSELNQVWTNLIINAVDAMNGQGTLSIKTFKDARWLVIRIQDSGPGIPEEIREAIFDPFVTTKAPGEGTGLGLNISHNIVVQKHKGEISVQSDVSGACFEVRLPMDNRSAGH